MPDKTDEAIQRSVDYYNSSDTDNYYRRIWGGESIHVGIYDKPGIGIREAARAAVTYLANRLDTLGPASTVIDLGSGFGGPLRQLVTDYGCHGIALNASALELEEMARANQRAGLAEKIKPLEGNYEDIPLDDAQADIAWSQEAFLHCGDRAKLMREVFRILKPGGEFIFADPMATESAPVEVLQPMLDRANLVSFGTVAGYLADAKAAGFIDRGYVDRTEDFLTNYRTIVAETRDRHEELKQEISEAFLKKIGNGMQYWVDGGENGHMVWGCFHFVKPNGVGP
jgi:SAM-dependent methyltransferase